MRPDRALSLLLLLPLGVPPAAAQPFSAPLDRSWMSAWSAGPPTAGFTPALWFDGGRLGYGLAGAVSFGLGGRDGTLDRTTPDGIGRPAIPRGGLVEVGVSGTSAGAGNDPASGAVSMRLHYSGERAGAWLAAASLGPGDGSPQLPLVGGGVWMRRGGLTLTTQVVQLLRAVHVDGSQPQGEQAPGDSSSVVGRDHTYYPVDDVRLVTGIEVGLGWSGARLDLEGRAGMARGPRPPLAQWAELRAAYWAVPSVALFASLKGTAHVADAIESVRGGRAAVGIQLAPGRRSEPVVPAAERPAGRVTVEPAGGAGVRVLFALAAETLDVSCDATGWAVVPAVETGPGRWAVVLPLEPGLHRITIRVNGGAWHAPPGLPKAKDDFGGEVGLLVVR